MRRNVYGTPAARMCSSVPQWSRPSVNVLSDAAATNDR